MHYFLAASVLVCILSSLTIVLLTGYWPWQSVRQCRLCEDFAPAILLSASWTSSATYSWLSQQSQAASAHDLCVALFPWKQLCWSSYPLPWPSPSLPHHCQICYPKSTIQENCSERYVISTNECEQCWKSWINTVIKK